MKINSIVFLPLFLFTQGNFDVTIKQSSNIEFVCQKKQLATNQCHYNFKVDGGKYHYIDIGCRFKKDDVIEKVKSGNLALAPNWKIECGKVDDKKDSGF